MAEPVSRNELAQKVLIHLYNSAVAGSLWSIAPVLRMKDGVPVKNPRLLDLQALYKLSENDHRLFYAAAAALAEFAVYSALYFLERYHRFDSEHNKEPYPQLSLIYTTAGPEGLNSTTISEHGSEELGKQFLRISRSQEMRAPMESTIDQLAAGVETRDRQQEERCMPESISRKELAQKVLIHLYHSAVGGSLRSTAPLLRAKDTSMVKNPRFKDLLALYKLSENDRRLFYAAATALAESAVYCALDFVERYNRFDSEHNKEPYPQLSLVYTTADPEGLNSTTISEHGTEELGKQFLRIARSQEMRAVMESTIDQLAARAETMDRQQKE